MVTKVGILGSGQVAQVLGAGFLKHGYEVSLGTRDPSKLQKWLETAGASVMDAVNLIAHIFNTRSPGYVG